MVRHRGNSNSLQNIREKAAKGEENELGTPRVGFGNVYVVSENSSLELNKYLVSREKDLGIES